jgi:ubiquitin thioesterase protein OTUB1
MEDELIIRQQEGIEKEISARIPLVGAKEDLTQLTEEYAQDPVYLAKLEELSKTYGHLRRMRPDGNCFFRAFCYRSLETILSKEEQISAFREKIVGSKDTLAAAGFTQFTVDDFYDTFLEVIDKIQAGMTGEELQSLFQEQNFADYLIVYLRILTSAELRLKPDFYSNFIDGKTLEEFCQLEVEPMFKESDHIHIIALSTVLGIGVRVFYMDRGQGATHNFPEDITPTISLLYKPGHYDILYEK